MSTSGSWNYSLTATQLINIAMENIGVLSAGETLSAEDQDFALKRLNLLVKQWQGQADMAPGLKLWTRQRVTLFLAKGQQTYTIGPASTDSRATTQYGRTTISAAEAIGQTVISITSNVDTTTYPGTTVTMTNADIVGIELDDGTIQWTTISGTPAATMTIANSLTVAASSGNYVYWFTSRAQRMPQVDTAVLRDENSIDMPLEIYREASQYDAGITDKTADGDPISVLIEPLRLNTRVTFNYQPTDVTKQVLFTGYYPAEDYDSITDDIAFPQEWFDALAWELGFRSAPSFGRPWTDQMEMVRKETLSMARQVNPAGSSLFFMPGLE